MKIVGNMVGCYSPIGKTFILVDENNNEVIGVVVDQEKVFNAVPSDVKKDKVFANDDGVQIGTAE